jgi:hypothetical protein
VIEETNNLPSQDSADSERSGDHRLSACSVLWLSLPDDPVELDAPLLAKLESEDAWTTDMQQAARLAGMGYIVKRRDRHVKGHLVETTLSAEVLDLSIDRGFEMRGARELNRPNANVLAPAGEKTPTKPQDV